MRKNNQSTDRALNGVIKLAMSKQYTLRADFRLLAGEASSV